MAQRKPEEKVTLDQVLKLVDQLAPEDLTELRRKLAAKSWGKEWRQLVNDVAEDNKGLPPLSDEEIMAEVKSAREELKAERARQSSS